MVEDADLIIQKQVCLILRLVGWLFHVGSLVQTQENHTAALALRQRHEFTERFMALAGGFKALQSNRLKGRDIKCSEARDDHVSVIDMYIISTFRQHHAISYNYTCQGQIISTVAMSKRCENAKLQWPFPNKITDHPAQS